MKTTNRMKAAFVILAIITHYSAITQNLNKVIYGIAVNQCSTANGHGVFYCPSFSFLSDRNAIIISPVIQKRTLNVDGVKIQYSRNLSGEAGNYFGSQEFERLQINCFSSLQFIKNSPLSYALIEEESRMRSESQIDLSKLQFSTVEATVGFQLQINLSPKVSWKSSVGASYYQHLNYVQLWSHNKAGVTLSLGTGIQILMGRL